MKNHEIRKPAKAFAFAIVAFSWSSGFAATGISGGFSGLGGCINACLARDNGPTVPKNTERQCSAYCSCFLEVDTANLDKYKGGEKFAETAGEVNYQALECRAKTWPNRYDPPPPISMLREAERGSDAAQTPQTSPATAPGRKDVAYKRELSILQKEEIRYVGLVEISKGHQELARQAMKSGNNNLISCIYTPYATTDGPRGATYQFWYKAIPDNFSEWMAKDPSNLLFWMGGEAAVSKCPPTLMEAEAVRNAGIEKYKQRRR